MPGVYVFTWDNCQFGEKYKHRQVMITNMPWLAPLARDCQGGHEHLKIGFGYDLRTTQVSPYAWGFCKEYASLLHEFVREPVDKRCVHCLPQGNSSMIHGRREALRRCAERIHVADRVDDLQLIVKECRGEHFLQVFQASKADFQREAVETQLGARCAPKPPVDFSVRVSKPETHRLTRMSTTKRLNNG